MYDQRAIELRTLRRRPRRQIAQNSSVEESWA